MAAWLQNVGNFLERLDDRAERVAEERIVGHAEEDDDENLNSNVPEDVQLQSILTARGLKSSDDEEDEQSGDFDDGIDDADLDHTEENEDTDLNQTIDNENNDNNNAALEESTDAVVGNDVSDEKVEQLSLQMESDTAVGIQVEDEQQVNMQVDPSSKETGDSKADSTNESRTKDQPTGISENDPEPPAVEGTKEVEKKQIADDGNEAVKRSSSTVKTTPTISTQQTTSGNDPISAPVMSPATHNALRESQKEARTLRRHVVALNKQLEHAETELKAQREELERAAERLEKDRIRYKEDREKEKNRHAEEIKSLMAQNDKTMKELKQRSDKQIEEVRKQLRDVEERRMQEGGDWNKELIDAVQREQDMAQKYALLEDEKSTLLSQISILQDQQETLGNRLESLSQTADTAMERERESETRLDEALNLHARQLAQRQARESELERTVAELGAALVAARSNNTRSNGSGGSGGNTHGKDSSPEAQIQSLQHELDSVMAQLNYEKQRSETLQNELRDVSRERTEEATANHARQIKHDRQIAELSHTIARLEADQLSAQASADSRRGSSSNQTKDHEQQQQMRELSEEIMRQREKLANCNSEISALRSRLKVANDRAERAESELETSKRVDGDWRDVEQPTIGGEGMRRRGGPRHSPKNSREVSMRAALNLDVVQGKSGERLGKALDGVDAFLVTSGRFLRHNALARLLFIAYLLLLHIWTFILIILHAHGFETVHGDFGAGQGVAHGPHALMQEKVMSAIPLDNHLPSPVLAPQANAAAGVVSGAGIQQQAHA